jgi:hypothetical protein
MFPCPFLALITLAKFLLKNSEKCPFIVLFLGPKLKKTRFLQVEH